MLVRSLWMIVAFTLLFFACDNTSVFEGKKDFDDRYWVLNDPAEFEFDILEPEKTYNLSVNVRNSSKYQFQNLYIQYYLEDSTGRVLSEDLKNIQLFNPITGVPVGQGIGDIFDLERLFLENYSFQNPGKCKVRIDQFMRRDTLPEILSVGIRVAIVE